MTTALLIVNALQALLLVVLVVVFLRRDREREEAWTDERRELLNRIAHPELVAVKRPPQPAQARPPRRDSAHKVGMVADAPRNGGKDPLGDDDIDDPEG